MQIDHLMWACSDLDAGVNEIYQLTGVRPEFSGSHVNMGTRNALLSLGESYLEIIAPDPAQQLLGNFGARLSTLKTTGVLALAMQHSNLAQLKVDMTDFTTSPVSTTKRETADGQLLVWDLLFVAGLHGAPFFIDWLDCIHPSKTSPLGCELLNIDIKTPEAELYGKLIEAQSSKMIVPTIAKDTAFSINAELNSPKGVVKLKALGEPISLF